MTDKKSIYISYFCSILPLTILALIFACMYWDEVEKKRIEKSLSEHKTDANRNEMNRTPKWKYLNHKNDKNRLKDKIEWKCCFHLSLFWYRMTCTHIISYRGGDFRLIGFTGP